MSILPEYTTPKELANHLDVPERTLRQKARELDAYSEFGNKMILTKNNVQLIMESSKSCLSKSISAVKFGTIQEQSPVGDYEDLRARLKKSQRKG